MLKSAATIAMLGACALCPAPGWSQGYPAKPVRVVVGFAAGSTTDLISRVLSTKMGEDLGQSVIVDNPAT
jgi:tripartite-type tricarboxylate transporter receptor subunit TctC